MRKLFSIPFVLLLAATAGPLLSQMSPSAKEIIQKSDERFNGEKSSKSVMAMTIVRPTWERTVEFKNWSGGRDFTLTLITAPARDQGQSFLKRYNEMWSWNPSIDRLIKLPPSMMSQGWMGSDYTNDDILKESSMIVDYEHSLDAEETIEGFDCYKIEMAPKAEAAVIWSKVYKWVTKDEFIQIKSEYYDEDDDLVKSDFAYEFKKMDGRLIPTRIEIVPADDSGKKTVLYIKEIQFDIDLPESYFSQQNMKRIR